MLRRARLSVNRGFSLGFTIMEGKHLSTPTLYPIHLRMGNRIFVPPEINTLVDLLLTWSVTGESPNKAATSSIPTTKERQPLSSPVHATGKPLEPKPENKVKNRGDEAGRSNHCPFHPIYEPPISPAPNLKSRPMEAVTQHITNKPKLRGRPLKAKVCGGLLSGTILTPT